MGRNRGREQKEKDNGEGNQSVHDDPPLDCLGLLNFNLVRLNYQFLPATPLT